MLTRSAQLEQKEYTLQLITRKMQVTQKQMNFR